MAAILFSSAEECAQERVGPAQKLPWGPSIKDAYIDPPPPVRILLEYTQPPSIYLLMGNPPLPPQCEHD